jgi:hypothetical protein
MRVSMALTAEGAIQRAMELCTGIAQKGGLSNYQMTTSIKESPLLVREAVGDLIDKRLHCRLQELSQG